MDLSVTPPTPLREEYLATHPERVEVGLLMRPAAVVEEEHTAEAAVEEAHTAEAAVEEVGKFHHQTVLPRYLLQRRKWWSGGGKVRDLSKEVLLRRLRVGVLRPPPPMFLLRAEVLRPPPPMFLLRAEVLRRRRRLRAGAICF